MLVAELKCPSCGSPIAREALKSNKPFHCSACGTTLVMTDWTTDGRVICGQCGTINDNVVRYCTACGSRLRAGCPFCYTENWIGTTWCSNCGANLQRAWERQKNWTAEKEKREEQRRDALKEAQERDRTERLQRLLKSLDEPEAHRMATYGLLEYGAEAVEPLIQLLKSDDPDARYGAAYTLGCIGDQRAVAGLIDVLGDREAAVRYWAVNALGKLKAEAASAAIGKLLRDKHPGVRRGAAEALKLIKAAKPDGENSTNP